MGDQRTEELEQANAAFYQAFEAADLDTMNSIWLDDPESLCVHPGSLPVRGERTIARSWALIMANTPYIQFFLTDVEVSVRGDVGFVSCTENVLTADAGMQENTFAGTKAVATNVFVRVDGRWRLWIHHASPVVSGESHED